MTGFGSAEGMVSSCHARVDVRTVNHRFFHCTLRVSGAFSGLERELRERLKSRLGRGHVTLSIDLERESAQATVMVDSERGHQVHLALREFARAEGLPEEVSLDTVLRFPEVISSGKAQVLDVSSEEVLTLVDHAIEQCIAARRLEGSALGADLTERLKKIEHVMNKIAQLAPARVDRELKRLRTNVERLSGTTGVDPDRIAIEIAILADKLDISEELVRLEAHLVAARAALEQAGPVGKRLNFLAQEIGREINTIGSKANDSEIAHEVVEMKAELERVREQLENIE